MRVIRAALRVSLFGGGTDLEPFVSEYGGLVLSFALTRYIYLTHNPRPTGGYRVAYSEVEELDDLRDAKHTLVAEMAKWHTFAPCTLTIISDVPKGTGLGSSSALSVSLVRAVDGVVEGEALAQRAYRLERGVSPVGWQDCLPAVFGGFNAYALDGKGVKVEPLGGWWARFVDDCGLLLYTGKVRNANEVLPTWSKSTDELKAIKALARKVRYDLYLMTKEEFCEHLNNTWQLKRSIGGVSDPALDAQYEAAREAGAWAGKLCGAGAGGCWFFLAPPERQDAVVEALGLTRIPFRVERQGLRTWDTER